MLEPQGLSTVAEVEVPERCMARFSSDRSGDREYLYFTTPEEVRRLIYQSGRLELDRDWTGSYRVATDQPAAWQTTIGSDSVWLMDMGRPPAWFRPRHRVPARVPILDGRPG